MEIEQGLERARDILVRETTLWGIKVGMTLAEEPKNTTPRTWRDRIPKELSVLEEYTASKVHGFDALDEKAEVRENIARHLNYLEKDLLEVKFSSEILEFWQKKETSIRMIGRK